jgi:hypothetical protein
LQQRSVQAIKVRDGHIGRRLRVSFYDSVEQSTMLLGE